MSQSNADPHKLTEEFNIVIQMYQPGFTILVHMLVSEEQAQPCMKTTNWENPERSLELQLGGHPSWL